VDIHSHLLPCLDDGPGRLAESLQMCRQYVAQGVRTVVCTPHLLRAPFSVSASDVRTGVQALSQACLERGIDLELLPGADLPVMPELMERIEAGEALTVADGGRYVLLELPWQVVPRLDDLLSRLLAHGLRPVLTHPERNRELALHPERLRHLVERMCMVQVTAGSFLGAFGPGPRRAAERFLREGLVHVVASDAHSSRGPRRPQLAEAARRIADLAGAEQARRLLCDNPRSLVLSGRSVACDETGLARTATVLAHESQTP